MSQIWNIARRDLVGLFSNRAIYGLLAGYTAVIGFFFFLSLQIYLINLQQIQAMGMTNLLSQWNVNDQVISGALGMCTIVLIVVIPGLAARSFAQERQSGSIELLLTSPVRVWEIVLGKYLAILIVVAGISLISGLYPGLLFFYGDPEPARTLGGLLSLFAYSAALAAIACFVSSLTANTMVAMALGFVVVFVLLFLDIAGDQAQNETFKEVLRYAGTRTHFESGLAGNLRSEDLTYFGVVIAIFLSLANAAVDSLRWR